MCVCCAGVVCACVCAYNACMCVLLFFLAFMSSRASERVWFGFSVLVCPYTCAWSDIFVFEFLCNANMRTFSVLRMFASILYDAPVIVCLRAHERVCVAYVWTHVFICVYAKCSYARPFVCGMLREAFFVWFPSTQGR